MSEFFRPIILNAFPESNWSVLTRCAVEGISLADNLIASEKMLNWWVGQDQRGDLRRVGVMYSIRNACQIASLPFSCDTRKNTANNCHHIELRSQNLDLHIVRTPTLTSMPRDTPLRDNARVSNQGDLFKGTLFTTDLSEIKRWYGFLSFNADLDGLLLHLGIGLPESADKGWLDIISILKTSGEDYSSPPPEQPPPDPSDLMKFHKHIEEMLAPPLHEDGAETIDEK
jgi:hypothetical protein